MMNDDVRVPSPRGSKPKSPGRLHCRIQIYIRSVLMRVGRDTGSSANLPSSHGGGMLPGNHSGLSGSAAAQTATDLALEGAPNLLALSFLLPPKKEALVAPTTDPFFCELHAS